MKMIGKRIGISIAALVGVFLIVTGVKWITVGCGGINCNNLSECEAYCSSPGYCNQSCFICWCWGPCYCQTPAEECDKKLIK
jgi:hypothetical protein